MTNREEITNRIAELRRDRGAATLSGKKFDNSIIASAEAELAALDDAEGERALKTKSSRLLIAREWASHLTDEERKWLGR